MSEKCSNSIAIVGAGPAGFFCAAELLKCKDLSRIDLFDRRPLPFGLVRYGVAPDHGHTRRVEVMFEKTLEDPRVHFHPHTELGVEQTLPEFAAGYRGVIVCTGNEEPRRLGIPGEDLAGVTPAIRFSNWVNGADWVDGSEFPLHAESVVIIGNGNVALDAARLLAEPLSVLEQTDMDADALSRLAGSSVRDVHVVGRRGILGTSFGEAELREFLNLSECQATLDAAYLDFSPEETAMLESLSGDDNPVLIAEIFAAMAGRDPGGSARTVRFHFHEVPERITGEGKAAGVTFASGRTLDAEWVITAIGHRGEPLAGLPFDEEKGLIPSSAGRVAGVPGVYVCGWIRRGAKGLIGHNRKDAIEVVRSVKEDLGLR